MATWLAVASGTEAWHGREQPLEVVLAARVDPLGAPDETVAVTRELRTAGADMLMVRFVPESLEHYLEQLEVMPGLVSSL
jgi:hypothetical protein